MKTIRELSIFYPTIPLLGNPGAYHPPRGEYSLDEQDFHLFR